MNRKILNELEILLYDVNVNEIAAQISQDNLTNWCNLWQSKAVSLIYVIKEEGE